VHAAFSSHCSASATRRARQASTAHGERQRRDRIGVEPVLLGEGDGPPRVVERGGGGLAGERSGDRQVREAADLQVRPPDPAGEREPVLEMAPGVVQPQRPQLGAPEHHQRQRADVVGARDVAGRLRGQRRLQRAHRLQRAGQIALLS
jgi:hypothetical protein